MHDQFIERWQQVKEKTGDEGGCIMYDMSKTKVRLAGS